MATRPGKTIPKALSLTFEERDKMMRDAVLEEGGNFSSFVKMLYKYWTLNKKYKKKIDFLEGLESTPIIQKLIAEDPLGSLENLITKALNEYIKNKEMSK